MGNLQQWGYRLFLVVITTALAFSLGWVGTVIADRYIDWLQKAYQVSLSTRQEYLVDIGFVMIGVLSALLLSSWLTQRLWVMWETIENLPTADKIAVLLGVLLGLALAYMVLLMPLMLLRGRLPATPMFALAIAITSIIVYFSVHTLMKVRDAMSASFIQQLAQIFQPTKVEEASKDRKPIYARDKVLDTNILIDGRLADIVRTGFIEGRLVIPSFASAFDFGDEFFEGQVTVTGHDTNFVANQFPLKPRRDIVKVQNPNPVARQVGNIVKGRVPPPKVKRVKDDSRIRVASSLDNFPRLVNSGDFRRETEKLHHRKDTELTPDFHQVAEPPRRIFNIKRDRFVPH